MVGAFPSIDAYAALEQELGHPPKYFQKSEASGPDGPTFAILVAFHLEVTRSVREVSMRYNGMTFSRVRKECLKVDFNFDQMIVDDVLSGLSHRELKQRHMIGGSRIAQIEQEHGKTRRPGNFHKGHSDAEIEQKYFANGNNARKTAAALGICRTTVSDAVDRQRKLKQSSV